MDSMKKLIQLLVGRKGQGRIPWLKHYLATYNSAYFQRPGLRYFERV